MLDKIKESASSIEYIDLGLSVKWANCNLGANTPEETGHRFSFEEKKQIDYVTIPTKEQCEELINNCTWKWQDSKKKAKGCIVTGKNGNSIFIPAVGEMDYKGKMYAEGKGASFWSSSFQGDDGQYAYYLSYFCQFNLFKMEYTLNKGVYFTEIGLRNLVIRPIIL